MDTLYLTLIISVILGDVGTWLRIAIQWNRDKVMPGDTANKPWELSLLVETFIGAAAGLLVWLIEVSLTGPPEAALHPLLYIAAMALGFAGTDAIENLLGQYTPT